MATIERDVSLLQRRRVAPIYIVYGSAVQIRLNMIDYTIPTNATVEFFAQCGSGPVYRCGGTAIGNSAAFTPPEGFFRQGDNALQLEINGRLIPLALDVKCEERISGVGSEETPEQVRPLVLQAQDAAQESRASASRSAGSASSAAESANAAAVSAESAGQSANAAAGSAGSAAESANSAQESKTAAAESARVAQEAVEQTTAIVVRTPYIGDNGNWYVYNYDTKAYADSGIRATGPQGTQGPQGETGDPATLVSHVVEYLAGDSGTSVPSGPWSTTVPSVPHGQYLWTRVTQTYNTGSPIVFYSVSRMGVDGSGSVSSVSGVSPDSNGNVTLTAENVGARPDNWIPTATDVGALPSTGGTMTGPIAMGGNKVTGLGAPTADTDAVTKAYADKMLPKTGGTMSGNISMDGKKVTGLGTPEDAGDAAPKSYVDSTKEWTFAGDLLTSWDVVQCNDIFVLVAVTARDGLYYFDSRLFPYAFINGQWFNSYIYIMDGDTAIKATLHFEQNTLQLVAANIGGTDVLSTSFFKVYYR